MKNKVVLSMTEIVVMVVVFAVAAALSLQLFAAAGSYSEKCALRDEALLRAQTAADILKATGGDIEAAKAALSEEGLEAEIEEEASGLEHLGRAEIRLFAGGEELCRLRVCWQED